MTVSLSPLNTSRHRSVKTWMENKNIHWPDQSLDKSSGKPADTYQTQKGEPQFPKQRKFVWICPTGMGCCVSTMSEAGGEMQPRHTAAVIIWLYNQVLAPVCDVWLKPEKLKTALICLMFWFFFLNTTKTHCLVLLYSLYSIHFKKIASKRRFSCVLMTISLAF